MGFSDAEDFLTAAGYRKDDGGGDWWEPTNGKQGGVNRAIRSKLGVKMMTQRNIYHQANYIRTITATLLVHALSRMRKIDQNLIVLKLLSQTRQRWIYILQQNWERRQQRRSTASYSKIYSPN